MSSYSNFILDEIRILSHTLFGILFWVEIATILDENLFSDLLFGIFATLRRPLGQNLCKPRSLERLQIMFNL
jgi:hypothetical protein